MADDATLAWNFLQTFTQDEAGVQANMAVDGWLQTDVFQQFGETSTDMEFLFKKVLATVQHLQQTDELSEAISRAISSAQELQECNADSAELTEAMAILRKRLALVLIAAGWDTSWGWTQTLQGEEGETEIVERLAKLPRIQGLRTRDEFLEHNLKPKVSGLA